MLLYSLEVLHQGDSNEYSNICFCGEIRKKYHYFLVEKKYHYFLVEKSALSGTMGQLSDMTGHV